MSMQSTLNLLGAAALAAALAGCSVVGPRQSPLPQDGPLMIDIYKRHLLEEGVSQAAQGARLTRGGADTPAELQNVRATSEPLRNRFQRLPNPDLEMHVYPHLASGRYPVPGYVTVFPMYESIQYALPGEVESPKGRESGVVVPTGVLPTPSPLHTSGEVPSSLDFLRRVSPSWYRVAQDFRADYERGCSERIDDGTLLRVLAVSDDNESLNELSLRYKALADGEQAYTAQRSSISCRNVRRAVSQAKFASR